MANTISINAPPTVHDQNDPISKTYTDSSGNPVVIFQSGASYYERPDGSWEYSDAQGATYSGAADGSYCDSFGYCTGAWKPGILDQIASKLNVSTGAAAGIAIGGVVLLVALLSGGRRH